MDIEQIRLLIDLMEEKDLVTFEYSNSDYSVSLTRHYDTPTTTVIAPSSATIPTPSDIAVPVGNVENSPMVGVFYASPSPNDPPFVSVGQKVQPGDTLGIIEAMKIMNPLEATQSGVIDEILVNNGDVVQFGQPVIRYKS